MEKVFTFKDFGLAYDSKEEYEAYRKVEVSVSNLLAAMDSFKSIDMPIAIDFKKQVDGLIKEVRNVYQDDSSPAMKTATKDLVDTFIYCYRDLFYEFDKHDEDHMLLYIVAFRNTLFPLEQRVLKIVKENVSEDGEKYTLREVKMDISSKELGKLLTERSIDRRALFQNYKLCTANEDLTINYQAEIIKQYKEELSNLTNKEKIAKIEKRIDKIVDSLIKNDGKITLDLVKDIAKYTADDYEGWFANPFMEHFTLAIIIDKRNELFPDKKKIVCGYFQDKHTMVLLGDKEDFPKEPAKPRVQTEKENYNGPNESKKDFLKRINN